MPLLLPNICEIVTHNSCGKVDSGVLLISKYNQRMWELDLLEHLESGIVKLVRVYVLYASLPSCKGKWDMHKIAFPSRDHALKVVIEFVYMVRLLREAKSFQN